MIKIIAYLILLQSCAAVHLLPSSLFSKDLFLTKKLCPNSCSCLEERIQHLELIRISCNGAEGQLVYNDGQLQTISLFRPSVNGERWENELKKNMPGDWKNHEETIKTSDVTFLKRSMHHSTRRATAELDSDNKIKRLDIYRAD